MSTGQSSWRTPNGERGTTLMEVIIAMGVLAVGLALAAGESREALANLGGQAGTAALAGELRVARRLAMMRRERVRVAIAPDGAGLTTERVDVPGEPLRRFEFGSTGVHVARVSNGRTLMFYPSGRAASPATLVLCHVRQKCWTVTVSLTGRVAQ